MLPAPGWKTPGPPIQHRTRRGLAIIVSTSCEPNLPPPSLKAPSPSGFSTAPKFAPPISGTILTKIAEKGNIVNQLSFNLKGSLCDMADLSKMEVDLTIQERDFAKIFKGQKCKVSIEALPGVTYKGQVSRLMPIADRAKGAISVRVRLEAPKDDGSLRPDMGVVVAFLGKSA